MSEMDTTWKRERSKGDSAGVVDDFCTEVTLTWNNRIVLDPEILAGKPVIRSTRIALEFVVGLLAQGWTDAAI